MVAVHQTSVFNIDQCNVYKMLTDPVGGSPTYSAAQNVPLIKNVALNPDTLAKELYGDGAVFARAAKLRQMMATVSYGMLDFDVLTVLTGSAVVDSGSGSTTVATQDNALADIPNYFKMEFRILQIGDASGSSLNVQLHKCKITDFTPGVANQEDFALQAFTLAAIPLRGTGNKIASKIVNTTAAALSA